MLPFSCCLAVAGLREAARIPAAATTQQWGGKAMPRSPGQSELSELLDLVHRLGCRFAGNIGLIFVCGIGFRRSDPKSLTQEP